jgi:hypothetical protein
MAYFVAMDFFRHILMGRLYPYHDDVPAARQRCGVPISYYASSSALKIASISLGFPRLKLFLHYVTLPTAPKTGRFCSPRQAKFHQSP